MRLMLKNDLNETLNKFDICDEYCDKLSDGFEKMLVAFESLSREEIGDDIARNLNRIDSLKDSLTNLRRVLGDRRNDLRH